MADVVEAAVRASIEMERLAMTAGHAPGNALRFRLREVGVFRPAAPLDVHVGALPRADVSRSHTVVRAVAHPSRGHPHRGQCQVGWHAIHGRY
jgi:hypothetical protein